MSDPPDRRSSNTVLLKKLAQEVGLNILLLAVMVVALGALNWLAAVLAAVLVVVYYGKFTLDYWSDLNAAPLQLRGAFSKYKRRVRGPPHYFLTDGTHRVRTTKQQWLEFNTGTEYELWYAPRTHWLLASKNADAVP